MLQLRNGFPAKIKYGPFPGKHGSRDEAEGATIKHLVCDLRKMVPQRTVQSNRALKKLKDSVLPRFSRSPR